MTNENGYLIGFNCGIVMPIMTSYIHEVISKYKLKGHQLSFGDVITHAVCQSIIDFPQFNSYYDQELLFHTNYNLGYSINIGKGPVKVVIPNSDKKSLIELSTEMKKLAYQYIHNKLSEILNSATFSVLNLSFFNMNSITTPLFEKQSSLFSIASETESLKIVEGNISSIKQFNLCLAYDVRVADCQQALDFLNSIKDRLEGKNLI